MAAATILVVEDEESIGQGLCDVLTFRGHQVKWEKDGRKALNTACQSPFDLILLDVMLPELDGFSVCKALREKGHHMGIILLTAKGSEENILHGFEMGADDYVTKPFSLRQLLARVDALLGRSRKANDDIFSAGHLQIDPSRSLLVGPHQSVELSIKELGILRLLLEEPGRIIGRRQLLRDVWEMPSPDGVETRTVDVHIVKLRKKLSLVGRDEIQSVRSQGYRFVPQGDAL